MEKPIATAGLLTEKTGITPATVGKALGQLVGLGIVSELLPENGDGFSVIPVTSGEKPL